MAAADRDESEIPAPPDVGPWLARAAAPWLESLRVNLSAMTRNGRLPHAVLLQGAPGTGQTELGLWLAERLLCDRRAEAPCHACAGCRLFAAGTHPDFRWLRVAEDAKDISIAQARDLCATLALTSYRSGAKVALVDPADAMNIHSFNALLKTLEEPTDNTWLLLAVSRSERVPRTIVSRTAKFRLPLPAVADALEWLRSQDAGAAWDGLLALAHGAPFLAQAYHLAGLAELDREMRESLNDAAAGRLDVVETAEAWKDHEPAARLFWLERFLTDELRDAGLAGDLVNNNRLPWLRVQGRESKIQAGYRLLDAVRDARRQIGGPLNTQLLLEGLLVSWVPLAGTGDAAPRGSVR